MFCLWCCVFHSQCWCGDPCHFLIINETYCRTCDWTAFDFDWYDAIMSGRYLTCWFNNSYCHLLFAVLGVCEKSAVLLNLAIFLLSHAYDNENFLWTSMPKIISVSSNLPQTMKLFVNLNLAILRWSALIPNAVIGDPPVVFNVAVVVWIGVLKLSSMRWYLEYLISNTAAPESMRAL